MQETTIPHLVQIWTLDAREVFELVKGAGLTAQDLGLHLLAGDTDLGFFEIQNGDQIAVFESQIDESLGVSVIKVIDAHIQHQHSVPEQIVIAITHGVGRWVATLGT